MSAADVLEPSDRHTRCPKKGEAPYHTIRAGDKVVEKAPGTTPSRSRRAEPIRDMIAFYWDRMDQWFEEDEEMFVHPRDPYHRVDVLPTSRHVKISLDGEVLAESDHAMALFESNLPIRWYLPREDVSVELESTDTATRCPYKGMASYYAARAAERRDRQGSDLVLRRPAPAVDGIEGRLCFFNERVDVEVDGEPEGRPETAWKHGVKSEAAGRRPKRQPSEPSPSSRLLRQT